MRIDKLIYAVKGCAFKVHKNLGSGLHERAYKLALAHELRKIGIDCIVEAPIHLMYDGEDLGRAFSVDILVDKCLPVELKATPELEKRFFAQTFNYARLLHSEKGMLINFGTSILYDQ